jgi:hypothetical protein
MLRLHSVAQGVRGCVPSGEAEGDRERRAQHFLEGCPRTWLAEEWSQLVAVVVGEGCAAPLRVFGGGISTAFLDARI